MPEIRVSKRYIQVGNMAKYQSEYAGWSFFLAGIAAGLLSIFVLMVVPFGPVASGNLDCFVGKKVCVGMPAGAIERAMPFQSKGFIGITGMYCVDGNQKRVGSVAAVLRDQCVNGNFEILFKQAYTLYTLDVRGYRITKIKARVSLIFW